LNFYNSGCKNKLKINIEDIKKTSDRCLIINFFDYIAELNLKDRVLANLTVQATDYDINISGNIKAGLVLECDRCLEPYIYNMDIEINEQFINEKIVSGNKKEHELTEGEFVEELGDSKELDIKDLIYQSIILELPNKNLCNPNCLGIKEFQGINVNSSEENIDERLEVFKRFSENRFDEKLEIGKQV